MGVRGKSFDSMKSCFSSIATIISEGIWPVQRITIRTLLFLVLTSFAGGFSIFHENFASFANSLDGSVQDN